MIHSKFKAAALAGVSSIMLSGCLLSPGKFSSELHLMQDGSFAYSYTGEIQMLALSKLAEMGQNANDTFEAEPCYTDDYDVRECTAAELAEQEEEWTAQAESRATQEAEEAEQMKAFMGGIDPASPEAAAELAERLERQRGWNSVEHIGDGLFEVDFSVEGSLTHSFAFPMIEKMPMANVFVSVILRDQGQVRVDAPGFAAQSGGNPMQGMMGGVMGMAAMSEASGEEAPTIAAPDGTFTIVTDGRILANNTDEGPSSTSRGQELSWSITPRTEQAPTALIAFD